MPYATFEFRDLAGMDEWRKEGDCAEEWSIGPGGERTGQIGVEDGQDHRLGHLTSQAATAHVPRLSFGSLVQVSFGDED